MFETIIVRNGGELSIVSELSDVYFVDYCWLGSLFQSCFTFSVSKSGGHVDSDRTPHYSYVLCLSDESWIPQFLFWTIDCSCCFCISGGWDILHDAKLRTLCIITRLYPFLLGFFFLSSKLLSPYNCSIFNSRTSQSSIMYMCFFVFVFFVPESPNSIMHQIRFWIITWVSWKFWMMLAIFQ